MKKRIKLSELFGAPYSEAVTAEDVKEAKAMAMERFGQFYGAHVAMGDGYVIPLRQAFIEGVLSERIRCRDKTKS